MPRSAISMSDHDGEYVFDIESYLCSTYPNITKPSRRAICNLVRQDIDEETVTDMIDEIVLKYALEKMGWTPEKEEEDDEE